jgi:hypothetical protein
MTALMHTVSPLDNDAILVAARETGGILTVEEHNVTGGLGGAVAETLAHAGIGCRFERHGVPDEYVPVGPPLALYAHYRLDGPGIAAGARDFLGRGHGAICPILSPFRLLDALINVEAEPPTVLVRPPVMDAGGGMSTLVTSSCSPQLAPSVHCEAKSGAAGRSGVPVHPVLRSPSAMIQQVIGDGRDGRFLWSNSRSRLAATISPVGRPANWAGSGR